MRVIVTGVALGVTAFGAGWVAGAVWGLRFLQSKQPTHKSSPYFQRERTH
jgi:hypothetical protein